METNSPQTEFLGDANGVSVVSGSDGVTVTFPYDRELDSMIRQVPGAVFDAQTKSHRVPHSSQIRLTEVVAAMRKEALAIASDLESISEMATSSALKLQKDNGSLDNAVPQISSYIDPEKSYRGKIVNANKRFVAQETGFGNQDGAAFIQIHRLAALQSKELYKGDDVIVAYNDKFVGSVLPYERANSLSVLQAMFEPQNGTVVDGVVATVKGDKIAVAFNYNPAMAARIRRVEGAEFNKDDKVWEIPMKVKDFALYAISDLRKAFVLDAKELEQLTAVAEAKIDNPKIYTPDVKKGDYYGVILEVGERMALQSGGRGNFNVHHLSLLDQVPVKGHDVKIEYTNGRGAVIDKQLEKGAGVGR